MQNSRLRDVAALAGVSIRTVSNVVNGYAPVAEPTRLRVQAAIDELGYRPNVIARNLKQGRTGVLALVLPELDVPYFAELVRSVIAHAKARGYTVVIDQTDGDPDRERELLASHARAALFDGVILSPLALGPDDLLAADARLPLVLLGERIADSPFDHVVIDNVAAAREATAHLFAIGRRRLAAIGHQRDETGETARVRTEGFRQAHAEAGVDVNDDLVAECRHFHREDGARAMQQLLKATGGPPDAVFCYNDLLALGALRTLLSQGIRVPEKIAIIGFDDIEDGRFATPSLSTISPDKDEIARLAVERLVNRIEAGRRAPGDPDVPVPTELIAGYTLVQRESTDSRPATPRIGGLRRRAAER